MHHGDPFPLTGVPNLLRIFSLPMPVEVKQRRPLAHGDAAGESMLESAGQEHQNFTHFLQKPDIHQVVGMTKFC